MYVGCCSGVVKRRDSHWRQRNSTARQPVKDWLCTLAESPEYFIFEEVPDDIANDAEAYYTRMLREMGIELLNVLDGKKMRTVTRKKISAGVQLSYDDNLRLARSVKSYVTDKFCAACGDGPFNFNEIGNHARKHA